MTINLNDSEIAEVFGNADPREHAAEAESRWGATDAYKESAVKTAGYSKEDWQRVQAQTQANIDAFVTAKQSGLSAESVEAMAAAEAHRQQICEFYYACDYTMHTNLADMYIADQRFTSFYDKHAVGLAQYVRDAIYANAISHS
ncbi:MAG: hypothetical protein RL410_1582 [Actinomycetota bacterium]|jgi:hypothetical protein